MRFVTFQSGGKIGPGLLAPNDTVIDLAAAGFPTLLDLIAGGDESRAKAEAFAAGAKAENKLALSSVKLLAPIPRPNKLICIGLNYRAHAMETGSAIPDVPTVFNKFATAVVGPGADIVLPKVSKSPDYEAEMAFVIGKAAATLTRKTGRTTFGVTQLSMTFQRAIINGPPRNG